MVSPTLSTGHLRALIHCLPVIAAPSCGASAPFVGTSWFALLEGQTCCDISG